MGAVVGLALALGALRVASEGPLLPRVSLSFEELRQEAVSSHAVPNASALLLAPRRSALYVGARDSILALDPRNLSRELHPALSWRAQNQGGCYSKRRSRTDECLNFVRVLHEMNGTTLYACGTGAFQPKCAYISVDNFSFVRAPGGAVLEEDGKGKCPFNPADNCTSLMVDGQLYSGTASNYRGSESVVQRSPSSMRSELPRAWLYNPVFVASALVRESKSQREDDKVYFFFSEIAVEYDSYAKVVVPRIGRVCTGDTGGLKMLEKKWTSFLKSRLDCSLGETTFTGLRDAVLTRAGGGNWTETEFHVLYADRTAGGAVSAVCTYPMAEVQRVFSGHFKHQGAADQRWLTYAGPLLHTRPGHCPLGWNSQDLPSETLNFISDHPLMDEAVEAERGRPWLLVPGVSYARLLVADVAALDGRSWRTALLGTDTGALHRAVLLGPGAPHLVEELQVLGQQEPVLSMVLTHDQTAVVVAGPTGVVRLPVCRCGRYRACWDCVRARDPCCAWDPQRKRCRQHAGESSTQSWLQDVGGGNATALCSAHPPALLLPCLPPSRAALLSWERDSGPAPGRPLPPPEGGLLLRQDALGPPRDLTGTYLCWAEEGGHRRLVANYTVEVLDSSSKSSASTVASTTKRKSLRQPTILEQPMTSAASTTSDLGHHLYSKDSPSFGGGFAAGMVLTLALMAAAAAAYVLKRRFYPTANTNSPASSNGRATTEAELGRGNGNANGNNNAEEADGARAGTAVEDGRNETETQKPLLLRSLSRQQSSEA